MLKKRANKVIILNEGDIFKFISSSKPREIIYIVCENGNLIIKERL